MSIKPTKNRKDNYSRLMRVRDALAAGAEIIATACPFCLLTIEDSIKTMSVEDKIVVKDIMELVAEAHPHLKQ
jgi:Fe-S oxidoreductase